MELVIIKLVPMDPVIYKLVPIELVIFKLVPMEPVICKLVPMELVIQKLVPIITSRPTLTTTFNGNGNQEKDLLRKINFYPNIKITNILSSYFSKIIRISFIFKAKQKMKTPLNANRNCKKCLNSIILNLDRIENLIIQF